MNAKYPDRCASFLLAKIYKPTWTKTTKFQGEGALLPEILWFWSCVGKNQILIAHQKEGIDRTKKGQLATKKSTARD
jgi:hypothetical protein